MYSSHKHKNICKTFTYLPTPELKREQVDQFINMVNIWCLDGYVPLCGISITGIEHKHADQTVWYAITLMQQLIKNTFNNNIIQYTLIIEHQTINRSPRLLKWISTRDCIQFVSTVVKHGYYPISGSSNITVNSKIITVQAFMKNMNLDNGQWTMDNGQ